MRIKETRMIDKVMLILLVGLFGLVKGWAQSTGWQQRVEYTIAVDMDVQTNRFAGQLTLRYFNNSPDTLDKVYFHLYYNAFQPGSMMDVRSRSIPDPDRRVTDRIYHLKPEEQGYHKIRKLTQDGKKLEYNIEGTVMTVFLEHLIMPKDSTTFYISFDSQVPVQIRRTGRDSKEGIRYSMSQWYPKIAEYDRRGWHPHQYIAREFYAPWGDFDVKITIDSAYLVAAGGVLQNPDEIGKGYSASKPTSPKLTYHFKADNVHDFMWAADPDFEHDIVRFSDDLAFHYFYQSDTLVDNWASLQSYMIKALPFIEDNFGKYPYPVYSFIQGGDGGMEYPMGTMITGHRNMESLLGVAIHEFMHSWYQMMLGTNESYLYWMDEGFTTYATNLVKDYLLNTDSPSDNAHEQNYRGYVKLVEASMEEPMSTHADHFMTNRAYSIAAYYKGAITLRQLEYIIGKERFKEGMLMYYTQYRFKHPDMIDFMRVMEKVSGIELDWYFDYWVNTTQTIDYGIRNVSPAGKNTRIQLEKIGGMPMPQDIKITLNNGKEQWYHISLAMMLADKSVPAEHSKLTAWPWVNPYYAFEVDVPLEDITAIEIDPLGYTADTDLSNNSYPLKSSSLEKIGEVR